MEQSSRTLGSCPRCVRMQESNLLSGSSLAGTLRGPLTQGQIPKEAAAVLAIKLLLTRSGGTRVEWGSLTGSYSSSRACS